MKSVRIRNILIGEGLPKICVPITGPRKEDVLSEARHMPELHPDVVELRADCFDDVCDFETLENTLSEVREILGDTPILFTIRSFNEGGAKEINDEAYIDINISAVQSGLIDMVDVELFKGKDIVEKIVEAAHDDGVSVIISNHDFKSTPNKEIIAKRLCAMQDMGADIVKIALMPNNEDDVNTLIDAATEVCRDATCPVIAISMGDMGRVSRTDCERIGTSVTFASATNSSAPGQINIKELREELMNKHGLSY